MLHTSICLAGVKPGDSVVTVSIATSAIAVDVVVGASVARTSTRLTFFRTPMNSDRLANIAVLRTYQSDS